LETAEPDVLEMGTSGGKEEGQMRCFSGMHLALRCGLTATPTKREVLIS